MTTDIPYKDFIDSPFKDIIEAVMGAITGEINAFTETYLTEGGTYIVASSARSSDDGYPHDLLAVLPMPFETSHVIPLRPTVNPDLVATLRNVLDDPEQEN